jgi:hypothetical protein
MPYPPALRDLFAKIREPLAAAKLTSMNLGRRDQILAGFKPDREGPSIFVDPRSRIINVPNDDPDKLITMFFDASGRHRAYFSLGLSYLANLEDTTFGDANFANIQSHRDTLSEEQQSETLAIAIEGGSLQAMAEYPTVEQSAGRLHLTITTELGAEDLRLLAVRIGVNSITPSNVPVAWNWLVSNTDQLQFDRITRKYHIVGNLHPVVISRHADILAAESSQPPARFVSERLWAVVILAGLLVVIQIARALLRRIRTKAGRCVACGYDLRGTPMRCPECGTAVIAAR